MTLTVMWKKKKTLFYYTFHDIWFAILKSNLKSLFNISPIASENFSIFNISQIASENFSTHFFIMPPRPRPAGGIERSGCPYVHTSIRMSVHPYTRLTWISRPINGSKLIFHLSMYLYETSRNIQEPWPHDLYFTIHWLRTLSRLSRLRFLSKVES